MGLLPAALFMLVVFAEGQFITPTIIGRRLEINNLAVILSLLFWSWMWGPMGAFLSSPILIVGLILNQYSAAERLGMSGTGVAARVSLSRCSRRRI